MSAETDMVFQEHTVEDEPEPTLEVTEVPKPRKRQPVTDKQREHLRKCREAKELKRQQKLQTMENERKLKREEDMKQYRIGTDGGNDMLSSVTEDGREQTQTN